LALPLRAQEHPALERGFAADKVYQFSGLDQVSLFNGALTVQIPIGGSYPLGGGLGYSLRLSYSSKFWNFEQMAPSGAVRSLPNRYDNVGVGWFFGLGRLVPNENPSSDTLASQYRSPDGGVHAFYTTLHPGDESEDGVYYTKDSTYLRLKVPVPGGDFILEFPDGSIHTFTNDGRPTSSSIRDTTWCSAAPTARRSRVAT
ncbi:MAG: hypothetical protein GY716_23755, partial [bacterium]|nr:hypothetical protein [bacterium]